MKSNNLEKIKNKWVKWEPIILYFLFSIQFNFEAYFWSGYFTPQFLVLFVLSFIPLYIHLTLYIRTLPETKLFYRIFSFLSNLIFFGITFIMKFQYTIFLYYIIVVLLFSLFLLLIIMERRLPYVEALDFGFSTLSLFTTMLVSTFLTWIILNFIDIELLHLDLGFMISSVPGSLMIYFIILRLKIFLKIKADMSSDDILKMYSEDKV